MVTIVLMSHVLIWMPNVISPTKSAAPTNSLHRLVDTIPTKVIVLLIRNANMRMLNFIVSPIVWNAGTTPPPVVMLISILILVPKETAQDLTTFAAVPRPTLYMKGVVNLIRLLVVPNGGVIFIARLFLKTNAVQSKPGACGPKMKFTAAIP
jgi:hypothetical protein